MALLAAVGLVVLYRIDEALALEQASLMVLGAAVFAATIVFVRDLGALERYRYLIAIAGIVLLLLPRLPGIGAQVNGAYLGVDIGPIAFQPAELAKVCIVIFLASYLREHREVMLVNSRKFLSFTWLPMKHLGPLLVVWGASMVMLVFIRDLGSSLMFFGAFLALLYVATNSATLVVSVLRDVRRRRVLLLEDREPHPGPRRHLARPVRAGRARRRRARSRSRSSRRRRAASSARASGSRS